MITAGILGLFARLRYLLHHPRPWHSGRSPPIELAGVVAHEAGHVRHRHLSCYICSFSWDFS